MTTLLPINAGLLAVKKGDPSPPTRGGIEGIPTGGVNMLFNGGAVFAGADGVAAPMGPIPDTLIPGYVCRLLEA
jgi:hypothetical protein